MQTKFVATFGAIAVSLALLQPVVVDGAGRQKTKLSYEVSDKTPQVGQKVKISGKVKPHKAAGKKRTIRLQKRVDGKWRTVKKQKARKRGYSFTLTPKKISEVRYRLEVKKARGVKGRAKKFTIRTHGLPSSITARFTDRKVKLGEKVMVRGSVQGAAEGRVVTLYRALPSGARKVRSTTVGGKGRYRLRVPTGFLVDHKLFVRVKATATRASAKSTPRKFFVRPTWKRRGKATSWKSIKQSGRHVRVNPCATVRYRVNVMALKPKARKKARRQLKVATRRVTRATGIRFERVGHSRFIPQAKKAAHRHYPADSTLVISWARQKQTKLDFDPAVAWGGGGAVAATGANGAPIWLRTKGWVVVEHPARIRNGFKNGARLGPMLMHEIGHVIGLAHPQKANQLMSAVLNPKNSSHWGKGDVRGLRAKGIDQGCISPPKRARAVVSEVELEPHPVPDIQRH